MTTSAENNAVPDPAAAPSRSQEVQADTSPDAGAAEMAPAGEAQGEREAASSSSSEDETTDGASETAEEDSPDDGATEAGAAPTGPDGTKKKRRRKRRKKKPEGAPEAEARESARPHRASERAPFHTGEEVFGKVTAVLETAIMVDLSGKALAIFDRSEMEPDDLVPNAGDRFVARVHNDGLRGGLVVLTRKPLREEETKPKIELALKNGELVSGLVTGVIKGGVEVDVGGVRAFAPASGMDLHPGQANFTTLLGQRLDFKIVSFDKGRDLVVTRRPMLEVEAHERRKRALGLLQEGQVLTGVVRT
ncbi:MAG TPA: S1 RNA-binding domain-containing protein, partial [Polyangiaceae bacterium]